MKKSLLILVLIGFMKTAYGAENMSNEDGYAAVVGVAGLVTTTASLVFWYFHQIMLKKDFARKELESVRIINELRENLHLPPLSNPGVIRVIDPHILERLSLPQRPSPRTLSPHALQQLFAEEGELADGTMGRDSRLSQGSLPSYDALSFLPNYSSVGSLPVYELSTSSEQFRSPQDVGFGHSRVTNALVGSLNGSPMTVRPSFDDPEELV